MKIATLKFALLVSAGVLVGVSSANAGQSCGPASWYALKSRTASGEMMNANLLTAAHKKMRFGTKLRVVNKRNGKSVVVRINDRGPYAKGRVLDLSKAAAAKLGFINAGHTQVCFQKIG